MKRKMFQRIVCLVLSVTLLLGSLCIGSFAKEGQYKPNGTAASLEEMQAVVSTSGYDKYISNYPNANEGKDLVNIPIYVAGSSIVTESLNKGDLELVGDSDACIPSEWENFYEDFNNDGVISDAEKTEAENSAVYLPTANNDGQAASAEWNFNVPYGSEGLYNLYIEYYNCQNADTSVSAIQRKLKIDGKVPFSEVSSVTFNKHWSYNNSESFDPEPETDGRDVGTYYDYHTSKEKGFDAYYKYVTRVYMDGATKMKQVTRYKMTEDINGNSMTPEAIETSKWSTYVVADASGYHTGYFAFYLPYGQHTLTLEAEREPFVIKSITWVPVKAGTESAASDMTYAEYLEKHKDKPDASGSIINIQAEFPDAISDSSIVPSNSNDSAINYPISSGSQLFNVIGETSYDTIGQYAGYKFTVNESGMYKFAMRYKQSALQGMFICRAIKLSGGDYGFDDGSPKVPFAEALNVRFNYDKEWKSDYIGDYDANGNQRVFEFYFEEGVEYTVYFECSLGDLTDYIMRAEKALATLNDCYLRIIQRTGSQPDANQDYQFYKIMPDVVVAIGEQAVELTAIADELEVLCGTNGAHIATLDTIARILNIMGDNYGRDIAKNLASMKSYLGTLGTWINSSKAGTLIVDTICVVPTNTNDSIPKAKANFFQSIWFEISSFIYSFFTDYDQMGLTKIPDENTSTVEVWLATGRDQSQIWRTMIDADTGFTKNYGHAVALKLVAGGSLLPSILAGKGPDVYMGLGSTDVINYAIRDAVYAVDGSDKQLAKEDGDPNRYFKTNIYEKNGQKFYFTDEEVASRDLEAEGYTLLSKSFNNTYFNAEKNDYTFSPAAMNTLTLLERTYGIPLTMSFAMMFYRMDALAQLNKSVPETWDELLALLPDLQTNNMTIGVSYVSALDFMIYQQGSNMWKYVNDIKPGAPQIYNPLYEGSKINLDSDIALKAFDFVCSLYTDYSLPVTYDAANRFRTSEMPIIIGDYIGTYNTLVIYASEIGGLWEFCSLPGSENPNEEDNFNYDSLAGVTASVIPNGADNIEAAWAYMQWHTGAEAQATYGNRIVALIGPAAKYETANIFAIEDLSWTAAEKAAIRDQMANLNSIFNFPGSYIIARYMKFAFLDTYNDGIPAHEAMMSYIPAINTEVARKREEFRLPIADSEDQAKDFTITE